LYTGLKGTSAALSTLCPFQHKMNVFGMVFLFLILLCVQGLHTEVSRGRAT